MDNLPLIIFFTADFFFFFFKEEEMCREILVRKIDMN